MAQAVLTREEIEAHDPEGGRGGRWLCPLPACAHHTNPRTHRSLKLEEDTGLWKCHRCGAGGQVKERWKPFDPRDRRSAERTARARVRASLRKQPLPTPERLPRFRLGSLAPLGDGPGALYLAGRGLPVELCHQAGVRFAPDFARREASDGVRPWRGMAAVVFPVRGQDGKLVASQARAISADAEPEKMTLGPLSAGLFSTPSAWDSTAPLAVVEAPIDALSLAACGVPAVATCGTRPLPQWAVLSLARSGRCVLLAHDADGPGEKAAVAVADALRAGSLGLVRAHRLVPPGVKDWNDALRSLGPEKLAAWIEKETQSLGAASAVNRPALAPVRPVQGLYPSDGENVPSRPPETAEFEKVHKTSDASFGGSVLEGEAADAELVRLGLFDALHPQTREEDAGTLPNLALLHDRLPRLDYPADTPERVSRWAARVLVQMVARGDTRPACASFARDMGLDLDGVLAAAQARQERFRVEARTMSAGDVHHA